MNKLLVAMIIFSSIASSASATDQQKVCDMLKDEINRTITNYLVITAISKGNPDDNLRESAGKILDNSELLKTSVDLAKVYETLCKN